MKLKGIFENPGSGKKFFVTGLLGILVLLGISIGWLFFSPVVAGSDSMDHMVKIHRGRSFAQILDLLEAQKVVRGKGKLTLVARLTGLRTRLKAGEYRIRAGLSSYGLLKMLADGRVVVRKVTIPEGKTSRQIAGLFLRRLESDSTGFMRLVNDSSFARRLGVPAPTLEGFLYPDTYRFSWGMPAEQLISTMVKQFFRQYSDTLRARADQLGWTMLEVVTLASIIEGEAVVAGERKLISAVYHNRLKRGMNLQADPTIQYIIANGPRRLRNRDLEIDSPYNTYRYSGLPPGPINNPGIASIRAALYPAKVNYLYFVAAGDGTHRFSRTYAEHLRAKAKFDRIRRQVERSKRRG